MRSANMKEREESWVTLALSDTEGFQALVLAKSLRRTLTTRKLSILISPQVSHQMKFLLSQVFDHVVRIEGVELDGLEKRESLEKLWCWNLNAWTKCVFVKPSTLVRRGSEELFDCDQFSALASSANELDTSLFVFTPSINIFEDLLEAAEQRKTGKDVEILREYFEGSSSGRKELPRELYGAVAEQNEYKIQDTRLVQFQEKPWLRTSAYSEEWLAIYFQDVLPFLQLQLRGSIQTYLRDALSTNRLPTSDPSPKLGIPDLDELRNSIAVVGLSCRFPGANNEQEYWELLSEGREAIRGFPTDRPCSVANQEGATKLQAGFLKCAVDEFDAKFFGISPREAPFVDPQQRLLLEVTWESLENAGINPQSLKDSDTGVFLGIWQQDYERLLSDNALSANDFFHRYLGNEFSATASRISFCLGLHGPAIAAESGCSSALGGLHLACESLLRGETSLAIATGVNLVLIPFNPFSGKDQDTVVLSKDFRCKTFDESADGFVRAEGCGAVILKRFGDAVRDGDNIRAVIRGSALNNDGAGTSFGTPNARAQERVFRAALSKAGVSPAQVSFLEAHGTGTVVGDPIEMYAVGQVYSEGRTEPLYVSSVKTNVGHCEAAAGIASLIKVILCLQHKSIPPHLNLKTLNPRIDLERIPAKIPLQLTPWTATKKIAAVSSFSMSGTNVHVIIQEPPQLRVPIDQPSSEPQLVTLSAKSEEALHALCERYVEFLREDSSPCLQDIAYAANVGRAHLPHRLAAVAKDTAQFLMRLEKRTYTQGKIPSLKNKVGFLFTGQGSQYVGMAKNLYAEFPVFRQALDRCDVLFQSHLHESLKKVIWEDEKLLEQTIFCQPAIFCLQFALVQLWKRAGIEPDYVLGHSVGEFGAAVCAGVLSLEDAMTLVVARSQLVNGLSSGSMLALRAPQDKAFQAVKAFNKDGGQDKWVDIAAINSPEEVVVSGQTESVKQFATFCLNNGLKSISVPASHAFHSRHMDTILEEFGRVASNVVIGKPRCTYVSGTLARVMEEMDFGSEYWQRHLRDTVRFSEAIHVVWSECKILVELGAQPILLGLAMGSLNDTAQAQFCPSLRRTEEDWVAILTAMSKLYVAGVELDWALWHGLRQKNVLLPSYPFQRQKFWFNAEQERLDGTGLNTPLLHPLLGRQFPSPLTELTFCQAYRVQDLSYIQDHRVAERIVLPAAAYLETFMAAGRQVLQGGGSLRVPLVVENLSVEAALELDKTCQIQTVVSASSINANGALQYKVSINRQMDEQGDKWRRHATATFSPSSRLPDNVRLDLDELKRSLTPKESLESVYATIAEVGIQFGPQFQSISSAWSGPSEILALIRLPNDFDSYICHPIVLDAIIQTCAFREYLLSTAKETKGLYLPISIRKFVWYSGSPTQEVYAHSSGSEGNVSLYSDSGELLAVMEGLELVQTTVDSVLRALRTMHSLDVDFMHEVWKPKLSITANRVDMLTMPKPSHTTEQVTELLESTYVYKEDQVWAFQQLNRLYMLFLMRSIQECDWPFPPVGSTLLTQTWAALLPPGMNPRLAEGYLNELKKIGHVSGQDGVYEVKEPLPSLQACQAEITDVIARVSAMAEQDDIGILFAQNFGEQLTRILQGKTTALAVLFPEDENVVGAVRFYSECIWYMINNDMALALFLDSVAPLTGTKQGVLRILEVGAGSASMSLQLIDKLKELNIPHHFTYTDISPLFVSEAKKKLGPDVDYQLLNIEEDPLSQGFPPDAFDIVLAIQVIHATRDIKESLRNVHKLLRPGGRVLISEQFLTIPMIALPFCNLDGWWRFEDFRSLGPIVDEQTWVSCLLETGFKEPMPFPVYDGEFGTLMALKMDTSIPRGLPSSNKTWIVFGDGLPLAHDLVDRLIAQDRKVICVQLDASCQTISELKDGSVTLDPMNEDHFLKLFQRHAEKTEGIIYIRTSPSMTEDVTQSHAALVPPMFHICKAYMSMQKVKRKPKFLLLTRGVDYIGDTEAGNPSGATISGIMKTFGNECPELQVKLIDLDQNESVFEAEQVFAELWSKARDWFVAFRQDKKLVQRLVYMDKPQQPLALPNTDRFKFINPPSGAFSDIQVGPIPKLEVSGAEVELEIRATALNFRDLFMVLKPEGFELSADQLNSIGLDISGVVVSVGPEVKRLKPGDAVFGFTSTGGLASHVVAPEKVLMRKPDTMTFAEASTIPCAFLTAYVSLVERAKLKACDRVLIHVASGGVGLAAIQVAKHIGAEMYVTAGNRRKRSYLRSLGITHVYHSRNTSYGEGIERDTKGQGVTVVLNSLTGPNFKETTLKACSQGARFVEIAKLNIWKPEEVKALRPDVDYCVLDLSRIDTQDETEILFGEMEKYIHDGIYTGLPSVNFPLEQVRAAFYHFQEAKHIGKVVVTMPRVSLGDGGKLSVKQEIFNSQSTYLITGGLGGLGVEVTKWMTSMGARNIVLAGRSPPKPKVQELIDTWNVAGSRILVVQTDIGLYDNCVQLLRRIQEAGLPPLRGIMHAAGVLSDNFISKQTWDTLDMVFRPKVYGGWYLHQLTVDLPLEFFIMFSSMSAIFAMMGQCNHVSANRFLDSLAHLRVSMGLPATTINWGAWSDVGAAAHIRLGQEGVAGIRSFTPSQGIAALEKIMRQQDTQVGVIDVQDWNLLKQIVDLGHYMDALKTDQTNDESKRATEFDHLIEEIQSAPPAEKQDKIQRYMESIVRQTIKLPENEALDIDQNFSELGVDSLMAMEMKNRLQGLLGHKTLTVTALQENRTVRSLSAHLANLMNSDVVVSLPLAELLKEDGLLPTDIQAPPVPPTIPSLFRRIFLTGVTGHLGVHFLEELLAHRPDMSVHCLIRAKSAEDAQQRLLKTLKTYDMSERVDLARVTVHPGNVTKDLLGLPQAEYDELSESTDAVVHCAIKANHMESYTDGTGNDMRTHNVGGLLNVLRFVASRRTKPLFHASSLLAATELNAETGMLSEELPQLSLTGESINMGYSLSKFVCEKLLSQAIARGLPVTIVRYPTIFGHSHTGAMPTGYNHAWNILLSCIRVRAFPQVFHEGLPLMPVDVCAKVSVRLFLSDTAEGGVYNFTNDSAASEQDIKDIFAQFGVQGDFIPFAEWRDAVFEDTDENLLGPLKDMYVGDGGSDSPLFSTLHPLAKNAVNFTQVTEKLKRNVPDVMDVIVPAKVVLQRHLDYHYRNLK